MLRSNNIEAVKDEESEQDRQIRDYGPDLCLTIRLCGDVERKR